MDFSLFYISNRRKEEGKKESCVSTCYCSKRGDGSSAEWKVIGIRKSRSVYIL